MKHIDDVQLFYGKYQLNPVQCRNCGWQWEEPNEKMTDVNIAVEILKDAYHDRFDVALLISADGDLAPAVEAVRELFPKKRVVAAFPPARRSGELAKVANACFPIGRGEIAKSLFPEQIRKQDGRVLRCPLSWK